MNDGGLASRGLVIDGHVHDVIRVIERRDLHLRYQCSLRVDLAVAGMPTAPVVRVAIPSASNQPRELSAGACSHRTRGSRGHGHVPSTPQCDAQARASCRHERVVGSHVDVVDEKVHIRGRHISRCACTQSNSVSEAQPPAACKHANMCTRVPIKSVGVILAIADELHWLAILRCLDAHVRIWRVHIEA